MNACLLHVWLWVESHEGYGYDSKLSQLRICDKETEPEHWLARTISKCVYRGNEGLLESMIKHRPYFRVKSYCSSLTSAPVHFSLLVAREATIVVSNLVCLPGATGFLFIRCSDEVSSLLITLQALLCQHLLSVSTEIEVPRIYKFSKRKILWVGMPRLEYITGRK